MATILNFLLFSLTPFSVKAFYPHNEQSPLIPTLTPPTFIVPLILDNHLTYHFPSTTSSTTTPLDLQALHTIISASAPASQPNLISIDIPLDTTAPASLSISAASTRVFPAPDDHEMTWLDTTRPGSNLALSQFGIRKGGMVSIEARSARLALETPFLSVPVEIYNILLMATHPVFDHENTGLGEGVVDCAALSRFPDLVLGLGMQRGNDEGEESGGDGEEGEIVITPEQYVMRVGEGRCVLLVRSLGRVEGEEVVLGWAAVRGRKVVLDWGNGRTGFGW
ncbi:hypothetical protein P153DRAFT_400112 [Dothidotthia symphoricarpi CBS 119687]|uniref:Peptidase A1 domain-containing protein n=1 Tax=Dothidotthia symphoricarpi CBS 119687 TaxID=1392245 RepID=A0A6A6A0C2_9PLEO|nr:uncharacterized protein P153DRAFT_400112 [Dothidotthia symphoricarpi CBS 119687]KAF2125279.1 hypothetical protein P153DRAFT_400112 [Dothidotthia symphoricarpi CBS 119687]